MIATQFMNVYRLTALVLLLMLTLSAYAPQPDNADAVVGKWLSSKRKNQVQIYKQGNKYYGRLVWTAEPNDPATNRPKMDSQNPDEKLRTRPIHNMVIMTNLTYKGNNVWSDGEIYNPEDGKTYSCDLSLKSPDALDLHGYVMGISLLGKTKTWTRVK